MSIEDMRQNRLKFLRKLYESTGGREKVWPTTIPDLGAQLGFDKEVSWSIARYLKGEGLLEIISTGGTIGITHGGIKAVEDALAQSSAKPKMSTAGMNAPERLRYALLLEAAGERPPIDSAAYSERDKLRQALWLKDKGYVEAAVASNEVGTPIKVQIIRVTGDGEDYLESLKAKITEQQPKAPRVFISHSSQDRDFVHTLVSNLKNLGLSIWVDYAELQVGDSIVTGISNALREADYFMVILSRASIKSRWMTAELNFALMEELSGRGIAILPVLIEDCELPPLLKDRVYADFRQSYQAGFEKLANVIKWATGTTLSLTGQSAEVGRSGFETVEDVIESAGPQQPDCFGHLSHLELGELRKRMTKKMERSEVAAVWFDTLESIMDNDMAGRTLAECVLYLIERAKNRSRLVNLIRNVCHERPDLGQS